MPPPTDAVVTAESWGGPLRIDWTYRVGDTFTSEAFAVLVDGAPVVLDDGPGGWSALAQARHGDVVVAAWSSEDDTIAFGVADINDADGALVSTATVALTHTPTQSRSRGPFGRTPIEVEVSRYAPDAAPGADPVESYTIAAGWVTALPDGAHQ